MLITNPHPGHVNGIAWRWDNRSVSLDMYRGDYGHMMIQVFVLDASTNQHLLTEQINMDHNPELFDLYKFEESRWNDLEVYLFVQSILECDD